MNKFCKIFVSGSGCENLCTILSKELAVAFIDGEASSAFGEISIIRNPDFDKTKEIEFPDGFLFFPLIVEVDFKDTVDLRMCIDLIDRITALLWGKGIAAIVASDFESDIDKRGGYKSKEVPWPGRGNRTR